MLYYFRYAVKIEKKQKSVSKLSFVPALDAGSHISSAGTRGFDTLLSVYLLAVIV